MLEFGLQSMKKLTKKPIKIPMSEEQASALLTCIANGNVYSVCCNNGERALSIIGVPKSKRKDLLGLLYETVVLYMG